MLRQSKLLTLRTINTRNYRALLRYYSDREYKSKSRKEKVYKD